MSLHYIYITTNNINGKKYLGQRKSQKKNIENDIYFGSGILIVKALKKYGKENFSKEIIFTCDNRKDIDFAEIDFIKKYRCLENKDIWYNRDAGGQKWRAEGHSEVVSCSMKQFYSDPRNRVKPHASRLGITIDEYLLIKARKELIKTLKKVKRVKQKEEITIRESERKEYLESDEYKKRIRKQWRERSQKQSNSEDFKRKCAEGKARALKENPNLYVKPIMTEHKIILAKTRIGDKATFLHHLFWDNNMTFGMLPKHLYNKFSPFISGKSKVCYSEDRIKYIHTELLKLGLITTIEDLTKHAYSVKKESYKRERS